MREYRRKLFEFAVAKRKSFRGLNVLNGPRPRPLQRPLLPKKKKGSANSRLKLFQYKIHFVCSVRGQQTNKPHRSSGKAGKSWQKAGKKGLGQCEMNENE